MGGNVLMRRHSSPLFTEDAGGYSAETLDSLLAGEKWWD
jgi:hypothetical protein